MNYIYLTSVISWNEANGGWGTLFKGWEVGGRFKRQGTYVYLLVVHVDVRQEPSQYCKAITFQLKKNKSKHLFKSFSGMQQLGENVLSLLLL